MKNQVKTYLPTFPLFLALLLIFPSSTLAHSIGGFGAIHGLTHPFLGLDHLLAMVAVGVIAVQWGGKALWQVPASFLGFMVIGGILAVTGFEVPLVESGIAFSVLALGVMMTFTKNLSPAFAMVCVGAFALFHGQAHGMEMPLAAQPALYALGFTLSTALLHFTGVVMGYYAKKTHITTSALRYAGVGMAVFGVSLLVGI